MSTNLPPDRAIEPVPGVGTERPEYWYLTGADHPLVAFSTRLGGVSQDPYFSLNLGLSTDDQRDHVKTNRGILSLKLGLGEIATLRQMHSSHRIETDTGGTAGEGDVLSTSRTDLTLAISTADCFGVALWDVEQKGIAAVHAGWRGILSGAVEAGVDWLLEQTPSARVRAAIGPGIRRCCFEVGDEVAERFPAHFVDTRKPRPHVDLAGAVWERLQARGVEADSILDVGACTSCNPDSFYSFRRDRGLTGRHWMLVRLDPLEDDNHA